MTATTEPVAATPGAFRIVITTAAGAVVLQRSGDLWHGRLDFVITQRLDDGPIETSVDRRVDLHLSRERYQEMSTRGFGFDSQVALLPRIRQLYVVVHDVVGAAIGSIIIPAARLR